jgi:endonuclease-3
MNDRGMVEIIPLLAEELKKSEMPIVSYLAEGHSDPFTILISTLISLRTKDEVTAEATRRLFRLAGNPAEMLTLAPETIAQTIYPAGFYRNKSRTILAVCRELVDLYNSHVPDTIETLLTMPGVGRKTANLVVTLGFNKEGICVDTHVHRISNRLGYVRTKTPDETEFALRGKLPHRYWIAYNTLLVAFGRRTCRPVSPLCTSCPIRGYCDRVGVTISR